MPVAFEVTEASTAEQPAALRLVDQLEQWHLLERCQHLSADKGYDVGKLITRLWDQHHIKPVIDVRNCWQDGESSTDGGEYPTVRADVQGEIDYFTANQ